MGTFIFMDLGPEKDDDVPGGVALVPLDLVGGHDIARADFLVDTPERPIIGFVGDLGDD
jgi:hypothetical protein